MKSLRVKIFGSEYPLRGEDEQFTKRVAEYVDQTIEETHERIPDQPPLTVAVLSALNITESMLKEKEKNKIILDNLNEEIKKLNVLLDDVLNDDSG